MKIVRTLLLYVLTLSFFVIPVFAHEDYETTASTRKEQVEKIREELKQKKEETRKSFLEDKCDLLTQRIDLRISAYENNKSRHIEKYKKLHERLENLVSTLKEDGYDTSELATALQGLDAKVKEFAADFAAFIEALEDTKEYKCGESEGKFKAEAEEARALLKVVHEDVREIKEYYKENIKPALEDLKDQKKEQKREE